MIAAAAETLVRSRNPFYLGLNLSGAPVLSVLALRRSRPVLTVTVLSAADVVASFTGAWLIPDMSSDVFVPIFALLLAMYSVGAHGSRREVAVAAPQPICVVVITDLLLPHSDPLVSAVIVFSIFFVTLPILGGRLVRGRSLLIRQLEEQGRELAEQRSAYVGAALARERLRVAGELDVDLADGMTRLVDALPADGVPTDRLQVERLESQARQLLSATRAAVVALIDSPASPPAEPGEEPESVAVPREAAQPWIVLAAAALAAGLLVETHDLHSYVPRGVVVGAIVVVALPLAFAWARPLPAIAALWAAAIAFTHFVAPLDHTLSAIGLTFVPPFVVAALEPRWRGRLGLLVCWCGALVVFGADAFPGDAVLATACWLAGAGLRERTRLVDRIRANNTRLEEQRTLLTAHAVTEERMRIARELHDAMGHALTVVAVQASAARRIWNTDRVRAEAIVDTVRSVARTGLDELRDGLSTSARHELASLNDLLVGARETGLVVGASFDDVVDDLTATHVETVYRVVQEALTNVLKHSPGATVTIGLHRAGDEVELSITNTRGTPAPSPPPLSSGHGLQGMQRRVRERGGTLTYGPDDQGGFSVHARLPMTVVPA